MIVDTGGTDCPICGDTFRRISRHWGKACPYPEAAVGQRIVLDGLVLAGAAITGTGQYKRLRFGTTKPQLAETLKDELGWLCSSVGVDEQDGEGHHDVFRIRTWSHPITDQYSDWPRLDDSQGRRPPEDYTLAAPVGRWWHALAGGIQFNHTGSGSLAVTFSALHDDRAEWITRVLDEAGFDSVRVQKRVQLSPTESKRWVDWIGEPVEGVEYKWATERQVYEYIRRGGTERPFTDSDCYTALEMATKVYGESPSVAQYRRLGISPSYEVISDKIGWNEAKITVGIETYDLEPVPLEDCIEGLHEAHIRLRHIPNTEDYRELDIYPQLSTILKNFDSWQDALIAAGILDGPVDGYVTENRAQR